VLCPCMHKTEIAFGYFPWFISHIRVVKLTVEPLSVLLIFHFTSLGCFRVFMVLMVVRLV
jgi:hypothetical protein